MRSGEIKYGTAAVIDSSCSLFDQTFLASAFDGLGVAAQQATPQQLALPEGVSRCIYLVSAASGMPKYQCEFVCGAKQVEQWIVVLLEEDEAATGPVKRGWENALRMMDAAVQVISAKPENLAEALREHWNAFHLPQKACYAVASRREGNGRRTLAALLQRHQPEAEILICGEEELAESCKGARHIFLLGTQPGDFQLPPPEDGAARVTLLYNKVDQAPIQRILAQQAKRDVLQQMNRSGWNISSAFPRFFVTSLYYEALREQLESSAVTCNELRLMKSFVLWDAYGLPQPRGAYTDAAITGFLGSFHDAARFLLQSA